MQGGADTDTPTGSLETALAHTGRLLRSDPAMAEQQAREILTVAPGHADARLMLGIALRRQQRPADAIEVLEALARDLPKAAPVRFQLGLALGELGRPRPAIAELNETVRLEPTHPEAWRALGNQLTMVGDAARASDAYARHMQAQARDPELLQAAQALVENRLAVAERLLRDRLKQQPNDVAALRMLAETAARLGRYEAAEALLAHALKLAPGLAVARHNYAIVLYRLNKAPEALAEVNALLAREPRNPAYRSLRAAALGHVGEYEAAIDAYSELLEEFPEQPKSWMSLGHALKTVGRLDDSIGAYRRSLEQLPTLGEAWWSLANLKTVQFGEADVAAMQAALRAEDLGAEDRFHLHFALGKALEDAGRFEESFEHYRQGNALRHEGVDYDPDEMASNVARAKALYTPAFFAERTGAGDPRGDPIFVVGLPRSGSTLVEQILASHSLVEGTHELPNLISIAKRLTARKSRKEPSAYPEVLAGLSREQLAELGAEYLEGTRIQRKTDRPFFIDKMPNNWLHTGLIALILPNAKVVDARRHPLACGFSNFKQHFARGQTYTYDLEEIGRYYAGYVDLMAHFDAVLPDRVHRVIYERMVADPEAEVRSLLDHCGLEFEDRCLRFWETERAVRTASSEQVRRPIFTDAVEQWLAYEPWLGPLKAALGPALAAYPEAPG